MGDSKPTVTHIIIMFFFLFNGKVETLQVFVERRGTAKQPVAAGTGAELINGFIVEFEGFTVEGDGGLAGLTCSEFYLLESAEILD